MHSINRINSHKFALQIYANICEYEPAYSYRIYSHKFAMRIYANIFDRHLLFHICIYLIRIYSIQIIRINLWFEYIRYRINRISLHDSHKFAYMWIYANLCEYMKYLHKFVYIRIYLHTIIRFLQIYIRINQIN